MTLTLNLNNHNGLQGQTTRTTGYNSTYLQFLQVRAQMRNLDLAKTASSRQTLPASVGDSLKQNNGDKQNDRKPRRNYNHD